MHTYVHVQRAKRPRGRLAMRAREPGADSADPRPPAAPPSVNIDV